MSNSWNEIVKESIVEDIYDMSVDELACRICAIDKISYHKLMIMIEDVTEDIFDNRSE